MQTASAPTAGRLALPLWHETYAAPFAPTSRREMDALGWKFVDVVFVTGDAYIDHPSFAMAILHRVLEQSVFRVAILSQPDWHTVGRVCTLPAYLNSCPAVDTLLVSYRVIGAADAVRHTSEN